MIHFNSWGHGILSAPVDPHLACSFQELLQRLVVHPSASELKAETHQETALIAKKIPETPLGRSISPDS